MLERSTCLATVLVCATAWPCSPAMLEPFTAKGSTARKLALSVRPKASSLTEGSAPVWQLPISAFEVLFAPDDSWVAFSPNLGSTTVGIVATKPGASYREIDLVSRLTRDDRAFLTETSCGLMWFSGWKATPQGLQVVVTQNAQARPTQAAAPGISFLIAVDGTVTRQTAPLEVDLLKLAEQWQGPASRARAQLVRSILQLSSTETGQEQVKQLAPFLRKVFTTADVQPEELDAAARLVGSLPPAELKPLAELALTRPGAEAPLLWGMREQDLAVTLATRIFKDPARSGRARATAVRVGSGDGARGYGELLAAGLADPDPEVRDSAADNVARAKCTDALLTDVLAVSRKELDHPTEVKDNAFAHTRLIEHYQRAIAGCLRDSDPAPHATVAAAISSGLRLEPSQYSTPRIYLSLVAWAEHTDPNSVPRLLDLAEQACRAQKYDHGNDPRNQVIQWRLLRALKASDLKAAKAQLAILQSAKGRVLVLEPADLGKTWSVPQREEDVADFAARIRRQLEPGKPAKRTPGAKPPASQRK